MHKKLDFLTKLLVDKAILTIDKNGISPKREGKGYAVSFGEKRYPFKLIVTEAAKIAGVDLTSNDFSSSEVNRNSFQKLTDYAIINLGIEGEYSKFKRLLEYFVAHLEWVVSGNDKNIGFEEYILPLTEHNNFKRSGQGYADGKIQLQIKEWQSYANGQICINVQANFGDYKSAKSYLNWRGTGLNIIANWSENKIITLYQEEYLHWEKNPTRKKFGKEITLISLGLFDKKENVTTDLIDFFESFQTSIVNFNKLNTNRKMTAKLEPYIDLINYKKQIILQGPPGTGKTRLAKELTVEMLGLENVRDLSDNEQFKLIQFHPSYTYEDFVRGIVAQSKGDQIEYKNVNKTLGLFAKEALKNLRNSKKVPELISKENWAEENYLKFKEDLEKQLQEGGEIIIRDKTKPKITTIEEDALRVNRYSNEKDSTLVKDTDIIDGYIGLHLTNPSIKIKENFSLSKSARSGMYYLYQNLIEKFNHFLKSNSKEFELTEDFKPETLKKFIVVIDEINRANLSSVLGELIYALEYRGEAVESMYAVDDDTKLILPPNLFIIGTMNTADRSVGHIDYAIRRRFAFVNVLPKNLSDEEETIFDSTLFNSVKELFTIDDYKTRSSFMSTDFDPQDVALGHSYFIDKSDEGGSMPTRWKYEIKPILLEYIKDGILKESARVKITELDESLMNA